MATSLLILSDTHVPTRARTLPDVLWREVEEADIVLHAGDWMSADFYREVEARSRRLIAVWGNNDGDELRRAMPEVARETIEGLSFAITHETGSSTGREARCDLAFPDADVLVFGHSHIPWDSITPPGDATAESRIAHGPATTAAVFLYVGNGIRWEPRRSTAHLRPLSGFVASAPTRRAISSGPRTLRRS